MSKKSVAAYGEALAHSSGYESYAQLASKVAIDRAQEAYDRAEEARKQK